MVHEISDIIRKGRTFLVTSHARLDGDALGSELALYLALRSLGKEVRVYNRDITPHTYRFLPGADVIVNDLKAIGPCDALFVLDCSELSRIGGEAERLAALGRTVIIDHHLSNEGFGDVCWIDSAASSTGEMVYRVLREVPAKVTADMATNLYTAIMTDTGSFRYSNTTGSCLRVAAELLECGADLLRAAEELYEKKALVHLRLLGAYLGTIEVDGDGAVGTAYVTMDMMNSVGALPEHTEGLVDTLRSIDGVRAAAFFQEMDDGRFKISLRSKGTVNVETVAKSFGGGGHRNASACRVAGALDEVKAEVVRSLRAAVA